ncbi:MAG: hypothetical protein WC634_05215 [archaeon]
MKRPGPKMRKIGIRTLGKLIGMEWIPLTKASLSGLYAKSPQLYRTKDNEVIAFGASKKPFLFVISRVHRPTGIFYEMATARIMSSGNRVHMMDAKQGIYHARGFNISRLFLNQAIAMARERSLGEIEVFSDEPGIQNLLKRLGFEFEGDVGTFSIEKK